MQADVNKLAAEEARVRAEERAQAEELKKAKRLDKQRNKSADDD